TLALRWEDVEWSAGRFRVRSPKTEHHEGGAERWVPLFPELLPYLRDAFDPESVYVISRYRDPQANLRTQLLRIIEKAGVKPWPKLFHNLRPSRETELARRFPVAAVAKWFGHSVEVAGRHYLQTTDADFKAAQNPAHGTLFDTGFDGEESGKNPEENDNRLV